MMDLQTRLIYCIVMLASLAAALTLIRRQQEKLPLDTYQRSVIAIAAMMGAFLGAKLPFLLERDWSGLVSPSLWLSDGKTILGGIFGGYLAVEIAKRMASIRVRTGDSFALPVAVAVAIGRLGCFVAGCCYGCQTTVPWGVHFRLAHDPEGVARHPTQLYEFVFHVLGALWLVIAEQRSWLPGNRLKVYLLAYLGFRFLTEWLRPEPIWLLGLTMYQVACGVLAVMLVVLWCTEKR